MPAPDDQPFRITTRWKECVIYWEGERGFEFDGAWGVEPPLLYIPDATTWDQAVPPWLQGLYTEIHDRLAAGSGHAVITTTSGYENIEARMVTGSEGRSSQPVSVLSIGWETDLMLRRLAGSEVDEHSDHIVVRTPQNPTFYWGNFVLLRRQPDPVSVREWINEFPRLIPDRRHVAIGIDAEDESADVAAEFRAHGFTGERDVVLATTSPTTGTTPATGYAFRELTPADWDAALQLRLTVDRSPHTREFNLRRHDELRQLCLAGHGVWFGAFAGSQMCSGMGVFTDGRGVARMQHVETHPDHRRRGLARVLLHEATAYALTEMKASSVVIVADPGYFAADMYRAVGFVDVHHQTQWQRVATT